MSGTLFWIIIAAFYVPLHFGGPLGVVLLTSESNDARQRLIRTVILECSLTMILAFGVVVWLSDKRLGFAMGILLVSILVPYALLFFHRRQIH